MVKNKFVLIICLCAIALGSSAQSQKGLVRYKYIENLYGNTLPYPTMLYFTDTHSVFIKQRGKKGWVRKNPDGTDWDAGQLSMNLQMISWYEDTIGCVYYKNRRQKKMFIREFFNKTAYICEDKEFPIQQWQILPDKKKIGSFECQKAKAKFRGRNYIAWFALAIPIKEGPWKLHGLPGLILEAYDETLQIQFLFEAIEIPTTDATLIVIPTHGKKVSFEDFFNAENYEFQQEVKRINANPELRGNVTVQRAPRNPIEKYD